MFYEKPLFVLLSASAFARLPAIPEVLICVTILFAKFFSSLFISTIYKTFQQNAILFLQKECFFLETFHFGGDDFRKAKVLFSFRFAKANLKLNES